MKKNLLFIIPSLCSGGAEKSLVSLLSLIDFEKYNVDLFLFRREGLFLENIPPQVRITDGGDNYRLFDGNAAKYIKFSLKNLNIGAVFNRMIYSKVLSTGNRSATWNCLKKALPAPAKHYDAAIAYLEGNPIYYCADCVDADIKIGYIHSDYRKLKLDKKFDEGFFKKLDHIVTISPECKNALKETFPEVTEKFKTIENITSPSLIKELAKKDAEEYENVSCKKILTVGRISSPKGYDMAVEAADILNKKGCDFKWFSIGKGEMQPQIDEEIKSRNLTDKFILLGERANPYPYIKGCDIYVQPSYYEGKSIAIDEAKAFAKPIVCTKFPTVYDQLTDGKTATLAEINAQSIAEKIELLLNDESLCNTLTENLKKEDIGNENEIDKFYRLLEGRI